MSETPRNSPQTDDANKGRALVPLSTDNSTAHSADSESGTGALSRLRKAITARTRSVLALFGAPQKEPWRREPGFEEVAHAWSATFYSGGPGTGDGERPAPGGEPPRQTPSGNPDKWPEKSPEKPRKFSDARKLAGAVTLAVAAALGVGAVGGAAYSQRSAPDEDFNKFASKVGWVGDKKTGYEIYQEQQGKIAEAGKLSSANAQLKSQLETELTTSATNDKKLKAAEARLAELEKKWKNGKVVPQTSATQSGTAVASAAKATEAKKTAKSQTQAVDFAGLAKAQQPIIDRKLLELQKLRHPTWKNELASTGIPQRVADSGDYKSYVLEQQRAMRYLNKEINEELAKKSDDTKLAGKVDDKALAAAVTGNPPTGDAKGKGSDEGERSLVNSGQMPAAPQVAQKGAETLVGSSGTSGTSASSSGAASAPVVKPAESPKEATPVKREKPKAAAKKQSEKKAAKRVSKTIDQPTVAADGLKPGKINEKELLAYLDKANAALKADKRFEGASLEMKEVKVKGKKAYRLYLKYQNRFSYLTFPPVGETRNYAYVRSLENTKKWAERRVLGKWKAEESKKK